MMQKDQQQENNKTEERALKEAYYRLLPKKKPYYLEKNEISEALPRPTSFSLDILKKIYKKKGPVNKVYEELGIKYTAQDFMVMVGSELYSDRNKEIKSLFPERSWRYTNFFNCLPRQLNGLLITLKNQFLFRLIKIDNYQDIFHSLKIKLEEDLPEQLTVRELISRFLDDYEFIFKASLFCSLAISRLNELMDKENISTAVLLGHLGSIDIIILEMKIVKTKTGKLLGNSLEISSDGRFFEIENFLGKENKEIKSWWEGLSISKKSQLKLLLEQSLAYLEIAEYGRRLTVKYISRLRDGLWKIAEKARFQNKSDIFHSLISELYSGHLYEKVLVERRQHYEKYVDISLPARITSDDYGDDHSYLEGVAPGAAQGILLTPKHIASSSNQGENIILYVTAPSWAAVKYIDKVVGIVSEFGSLLSPLALVAREKNIPMVVNFSLAKEQVKIGDKISINGTSGNVTRS